jgi:hypothetical protein
MKTAAPVAVMSNASQGGESLPLKQEQQLKKFLVEVELTEMHKPFRRDRPREYEEVDAVDEQEAKSKVAWAYRINGNVTRAWESF